MPESVESTEEEKRQHGLLDLDNLRACARTAFKQRPGRARLHVLLLMANFLLFMFPLNTSHYDYLLTQLKYDWTIVEYSGKHFNRKGGKIALIQNHETFLAILE